MKLKTKKTKKDFPTTAFIAVTLRCNSSCVMCDLWKNKKEDGLDSNVYRKLPRSLRMIDITGGEPFLREDLSEIVKILKQTCPRAKQLITTNGYLTQKIEKALPLILKEKPNIAFRVSMDGWGDTHDQIRGLRGSFRRSLKTLQVLRKYGVRDIGVIFTLMKQNIGELEKVIEYCWQNNFNLSLNVVHDSPIFYGVGKKESLRPNYKKIKPDVNRVIRYQTRSLKPKRWAKAWFYYQQFEYLQTGKRGLPCGAGEDFFYLDPLGEVYICHLKPWPIGNLIKSDFETIWNSSRRKQYIKRTQACHDCWLMCSTKDAIRKNKTKVLGEWAKMLLMRR